MQTITSSPSSSSTSAMGQMIANDLSLPLILRRKESMYQQRVHKLKTQPATDQPQHGNNHNNHDEEYCEDPWVGVLLTCLLSGLLYLQFSISFPTLAPLLSMPSRTIDLSISLFFFTSILYRRTVQEAKIHHIVILHLMPEWVALITIGLCYCGYAVAGFVVLLVGKFLMAAAVVVYCTIKLFSPNNNNNNNNNETFMTILATKKLQYDDDDETVVSIV